MKLRWKQLFHVGLAVILLNLTLFVTSRVILKDSFQVLDQEAARDSLIHMGEALDDERRFLATVSRDWAQWDGAYRFMQDNNPSLITSHLRDTLFSELELNLFAFIDPSGKILFARSYDYLENVAVPVDWEGIDHLVKEGRLFKDTVQANGLCGFVPVAGKPMLLAVQHVLPNTKDGPSRGLLVLGRNFDRPQVERLAHERHMELTILPTRSTAGREDAVLADLFSSRDGVVVAKDDEVNIGYLLLRDLWGRPSFYLQAQMPRKIYQGGTGAIRYFLHWNFLVTLIFGLTTYGILSKLSLVRRKRREVEAKCHALVENLGLGVSLVDENFTILMANSAVARIFDKDADALVGRQCFRELKHRRKPCTDCPGAIALKTGQPALEEIVGRHADGTPRVVRVQAFPVFDATGRAHRFIELVEDITAQKEAERALRESNQLAKTVLNSIRDGVAIIETADYTFTSVNRVFLESVGLREEDVIGRSCYELLPQKPLPFNPHDSFCPIEESEKNGSHAQADYSVADTHGDIRHLEVFTSPIKNEAGDVTQVVWVARDVSERKKAEQEIRHLAYHDALTGLPNRSRLEERLEQLFSHGQPGSQQLAMLFLDLDRFKNINDTFGHAMGDLLLKSVSRRLRTSVREGDMVARLGGDEFVVLLVRTKSRQEVETVARKILEVISAPFYLEGQKIYITTSIGIALCPHDGHEGDLLKKSADMAMYAAKEKGRNAYHFYSEHMGQQALERHHIEQELRLALEEGQFYLVYQPQFDLRTGQLTGIEALLRWRHPDRGNISPLQFLRTAEETNLIRPLGEWVLETACAQNKVWQKEGYPCVRVSVNLSSHHFRDPDFSRVVRETLARTGLNPECLGLELAESVLMENTESLARILQDFKDLGIQLTVDTFDTGYAPLRYLKHFPIDRVKISHGAAETLFVGQDKKSHFEEMVLKARQLNLEIIAGGIETMEQIDQLTTLSCFTMQGYYLERPLAAQDMPRVFRGGLFQGRLIAKS